MPNNVGDKGKAAVKAAKIKAAVEATYPKIQDLTEGEKKIIIEKLANEEKRLKTTFDMANVIDVINENTRDRSNTKQQQEDNLSPKAQSTQAIEICNAADLFRERIEYIDPVVECHAREKLYSAKNIELYRLIEEIKSDLIIFSLAMKHASRVIEETSPPHGPRNYMKRHAKRAFFETYQALLDFSSPKIKQYSARELAKDLLDHFFPGNIPSDEHDQRRSVKKMKGDN